MVKFVAMEILTDLFCFKDEACFSLETEFEALLWLMQIETASNEDAG